MANIRMPAIAGSFYPADPKTLAEQIDRFLAAPAAAHPPAKAIIAPHAGIIYSGAVAGTIYASLRPISDQIRRVVLIGPAHRVRVGGLAVPSHDRWRTPLGDIALDRSAMDKIGGFPGVKVSDEAHAQEHCLEIQLPFLQRLLGDFRIVPILAGGASPERVDGVLKSLWGGPETLIVVSSDLSHFHDYGTAKTKDRAASDAIERLDAKAIADDQACGRLPIKGLIARARALDLRATTLDLRSSGDTAGSPDRVVGYGGYSFEYAHSARLSESARATLLKTAHRVLDRATTRNGQMPAVKLGQLPPQITAQRATFVTLKLNKKLRGCIGSISPSRPLVLDVAENAHKSAFQDRRFPPLTRNELDAVSLSVSILSTPRPIEFANEADLADRLSPDRDGVILVDGQRRGLFLPQVWDGLADPRQFIRQLKVKAGLPADHWSDSIRAFRFTTETFGDTKAA